MCNCIFGFFALLITLVQHTAPAAPKGTTFQSFLYGETVQGIHDFHIARTLFACAGLCSSADCLVFSWDSSSKSCLVFTFLENTLAMTPQASTLTTYYRLTLSSGDSILFADPALRWTENSALCVSLGGKLAAPSSAQLAVLFHLVTRVERLVVGMQKDASGVWVALDNVPLTDIHWDAGEPDSQGYGFIQNGLFWDIDNRATMNYGKAVCAIPS